MADARFEVFPRADGDFGWRLIDDNGEQIAQGEGYTREHDAERGVRNVVGTVAKILDLPEGEYPLEVAKVDA